MTAVADLASLPQVSQNLIAIDSRPRTALSSPENATHFPLQNLGYEKYASAFEEGKIGLLELPYLSEERLEQLGVPMGPRMRILQEAKATIGNDHSMNVYIL